MRTTIVRRTRMIALALFVGILAAVGFGWAATKVRVAVHDNPPLVSWGEDGAVRGIYADLLETVAKAEDWSLDYLKGTWPQSYGLLRQGACELLVAVAYTDERSRAFAFTAETVLSNWGRIWARRGSRVRSFLDLKGKNLAVPKDDVYTGRAKAMLKSFGVRCTFLEAETYAGVLRLVADGHADAGVTSRFARPPRRHRGKVSATGIIFAPVELRLAGPKGRAEPLLAAIDRHLARMRPDPDSAFNRSVERWVGGGKPPWQAPRWIVWVLVAVGAGLLLTRFAHLYAASMQRNRGEDRRLSDRRQGPRRAEDWAADEEEILASLPEVVLVVDRSDATVLRAAGAVEEILGRAVEDLQGEPLAALTAEGGDPLDLESALAGHAVPWSVTGRKGLALSVFARAHEAKPGPAECVVITLREALR